MANILKFLHPIMPFVTEDLNKNFFNSDKMLINSEWPDTESFKKIIKNKNINSQLFQISLIIKIISEIRVFRVEKKISFKNKLNLYIKSSKNNKFFLSNENLELISFIGKIDEIKFESKGNEFKEKLIFKPLEELILGFEIIDSNVLNNEKERISIEIISIDKELKKIKGMLSNNSFLEKAPNEVVKKYKERLDHLLSKKNEIQNLN